MAASESGCKDEQEFDDEDPWAWALRDEVKEEDFDAEDSAGVQTASWLSEESGAAAKGEKRGQWWEQSSSWKRAKWESKEEESDAHNGRWYGQHLVQEINIM